MKCTVIQIRGEKPKAYIEIICKQIGITSKTELELITAIYHTYGDKTFMLDRGCKGALIAHFGGKMTENSLKVSITRLISRGALIKSGRLIGLSAYFKDLSQIDGILIKVKDNN
jgi:hypothetical protein